MATTVTEQTFENFKKDAESAGDFANKESIIKPRWGAQFKSAPLISRELLDNGGYRGFANETELKGYRPTVLNSIAKDMSTRKIWRWTGTAWIDEGKSDLDLANEHTDHQLGAIDSNRVNSGKNYPFLRKIRAGFDYGPRQQFLDAVLNISIYGASSEYYYRIAVIENGSTSLGGNGQGVRVEKALKSTFPTTGTARIIHNNTSAVGLDIDYELKGVQRIFFKCDSEDVYIDIVIDVDKLPPFGTAIASANNVTAGYNWVIDTICNEYDNYPITANDVSKLKGISDSIITPRHSSFLSLNLEKDYPFQQALRSAVAPTGTHPYFRQCLVDCKVLGARKDYFYRISYLQNGADMSSLGVSTKNGISVTRIPSSRLSESYEQNIVTYVNTEIQVEFDREKGGLQTFIVNCPNDPITSLKLTFDVDKLPPNGTAFSSTTTRTYGFNSILNPACYEYADSFKWKHGDVLFEYVVDTSKVMVTYLSGKKWYRIHCARKSINNTFQPLGFSFADAYTVINELIPVEKADLKLRTEAGSDWHAPITFTANNNFDDVPIIYTSGAHGSDGGSGGDPTAEMKELIIIVDQIPIDLTKPLKCIAQSVSCISSNYVKAGNTYASGRYCLEQNFKYDLSANGLWIDVNYVALEDITMLGDNGCQHYLAGATPVTANSILFWGGNTKSRETMKNEAFNSGPKSMYPKVFGVTTRHPVAGDFSSWVDVTYGVGDREFLASDRTLYQFPRPDGKLYPRLFSEMPLKSGESYKWRGGYYWGAKGATSFHDTVQRTQAGDVLVKKDGAYVIV